MECLSFSINSYSADYLQSIKIVIISSLNGAVRQLRCLGDVSLLSKSDNVQINWIVVKGADWLSAINSAFGSN